MGSVFPCVPLALLASRHRDLVMQLSRRLGLPQTLDELLVSGADAPPMQLLRLAYILPATEAAHGSEPGGLVTHALRTANAVLRWADPQETSSCMGPEDLPAGDRRLVVRYLGALLRDLGKLWWFEVSGVGRTWEMDCPLVEFAHQHAAAELRVHQRRGRMRTGPTGYQPLALIHLQAVIPMPCWRWLGPDGARALLRNLILSERASECGNARSDAGPGGLSSIGHRPPTAQGRSRNATDVLCPPGTASLAEDFILGIRALEKTALICDRVHGHLLRSSSHTVIFLTMPGGESAFHLVHARGREAVERTEVGGYAKAFYSGAHPHRYIDELATCALADGLPWCVPALGADDTKPPGVRHYCVAIEDSGTHLRSGHAIIMRNEPLWGSRTDFTLSGFAGRIACFADDRSTPSSDAEDLGFAPWAIPPAGGLAARIVLAGGSDAGDDAVLDLPAVTRALIEEVDAIAPRTIVPAQRTVWQEMAQGPGRESGEHGGCLPALMSCAARLAYLRSMQAPIDALAGQAVAVPMLAVACAQREDARSGRLSAEAITRLGTIVSALVAAARTCARPAQASTDGFHAMLLPSGVVFLPWPRCLGEAATISERVLADMPANSESFCAQNGLSLPTAIRIADFPYAGGRRCHSGILVPAEWTPTQPLCTLDGIFLTRGQRERADCPGPVIASEPGAHTGSTP